MTEPLWLAVDDVRDFHDKAIAEHGGLPGEYENKLLSALDRPEKLYFYSDPKPDIFDLAASYAFGIAKNHPFADANKRTAYMVCQAFLAGNGFLLTAEKNERRKIFLQLAASEISEEQLADWLRKNTVPIES